MKKRGGEMRLKFVLVCVYGSKYILCNVFLCVCEFGTGENTGYSE